MTMIADGYHALAPGKLATVVTYLEMVAPFYRPVSRPPEGYRLQPVERWDVDHFVALYKEIGHEWLWSSRLLISRKDLDERLHRAGTKAFVPMNGERPMGILEMDFPDEPEVEISFFGLVPNAVGSGVGRWMMEEAMAMAYARPGTRRLWLHTCHLDSPRALPFYQRMGFRPYARAVEVFDDARLDGRLEADAGPHVPLITSARWPDGV